MVWLAAVALRNSRTPPLALVSLLVLTVAPVPTGERLSASKVMAAWAMAADAAMLNAINSTRENFIRVRPASTRAILPINKNPRERKAAR